MDNKTLIEKVADTLGENKDDVQSMVADLREVIAKCCLEIDSVIIPGFGQFEARKRKERITIHPASGQRLMVPPKMVVSFRPSGVLRAKIENSDKE